MTRFARAKGSKSSNERLPEEPTAWHIMKQQLQQKYEQATNSEEVKEKKWKRSDFDNDGCNSGSATWAAIDNPDNESNTMYSVKKLKKKKSGCHMPNPDLNLSTNKKQKKNKLTDELSSNQLVSYSDKVSENSKGTLIVKKISKKWKKKLGVDSTEPTYTSIVETKQKNTDDETQTTIKTNHGETSDNLGTIKKKKKTEFSKISRNKNKKQDLTFETEDFSDAENFEDFANVSQDQDFNTEAEENEGNTIPVKKDKKKKKLKNKKCNDDQQFRKTSDNRDFNSGTKRKFDEVFNRKQAMPYKRRKPEENVQIFHLNGRDIEIVKYDGFPVKKEDAVNLKILKQKMIAKGIPANEIKVTMKLERRKAEKALAREKKKVCFHCRNSGHVLSECPELDNKQSHESIGTGICFKCGSTEHTHFECRVVKEQDFRYAKCFVCNEQGHISRQCPDNPKGLYPKGGACRVCGDVTHLKKDCPDLLKEKEETTIRLQTLDSKHLEKLDEEVKLPNTVENKPNKKKIVKF